MSFFEWIEMASCKGKPATYQIDLNLTDNRAIDNIATWTATVHADLLDAWNEPSVIIAILPARQFVARAPQHAMTMFRSAVVFDEHGRKACIVYREGYLSKRRLVVTFENPYPSYIGRDGFVYPLAGSWRRAPES